jgi:hypothetical protein
MGCETVEWGVACVECVSGWSTVATGKQLKHVGVCGRRL